MTVLLCKYKHKSYISFDIFSLKDEVFLYVYNGWERWMGEKQTLIFYWIFIECVLRISLSEFVCLYSICHSVIWQLSVSLFYFSIWPYTFNLSTVLANIVNPRTYFICCSCLCTIPSLLTIFTPVPIYFFFIFLSLLFHFLGLYIALCVLPVHIFLYFFFLSFYKFLCRPIDRIYARYHPC